MLTDAQILRALRKADIHQVARMQRDVGPYEITEPTPQCRRFVEALCEEFGLGSEFALMNGQMDERDSARRS